MQRNFIPTLHFAIAAWLCVAGPVAAEYKHDPRLPLGNPSPFYPSTAAAIGVGSAWAVLAVGTFAHIVRHRAWWGLVLPIGVAVSSLGWFLRIPLQTSTGIALYAVINLFIILPPAAFIAFNYILFGRMIVAVDPTLSVAVPGATPKQRRRQRSAISFIPPRMVGIGFLISDIVTFLIQAGGGGLQATGGPSAPVGDKIFLVGILLQAISYLFFTSLFIYAYVKLRANDPTAFSPFSLPTSKRHPLNFTFQCLAWSTVFIIIRSAYRAVEMAEGYNGHLYNTEAFLIFLDTVPLLLALAPWLLFYPVPALKKAELLAHSAANGLQGGKLNSYEEERGTSWERGQLLEMSGRAA